MKRKLFAGLAVGVVLLVVSGPMFGHHNTDAKYDLEHPVTFTGTVIEFRMISPHSRIQFEVKDAIGNAVKWFAETSNSSGLYRRGWRTDDLKPGDRITVTGAPAKDGSKTMNLLKLVAPNGKEITQGTN